MLHKRHKKEKPVFTGITRGTGGFGLGSTGLSNHWIATLVGGTNGFERDGIAVDSSGNVYTVTQTRADGAGSTDVLIVKYDFTGTIQWQRTLGGTSGDNGISVAVDSSDNVYITGNASNSSNQTMDVLIAKYDSLGNVLWQRVLGEPGDDPFIYRLDSGHGIALDSSNNVYIVGYTNEISDDHNNLSNKILTAKYNSSGTFQWQRALGGTDVSAQDGKGFGIAVDSSNNVYIVGEYYFDIIIAKYNSSGTLQWQRRLKGVGGSDSIDSGRGIAVDSSDNVYITGRTGSDGAGSYDVIIAKYNSSGTLQWQRTLGGTNSESGQGIAIDNSDNLYIVGQTSSEGAGETDILIAKYNSSGNIQWQRTLGGTGTESAYSIAVDSSNNVYIIGETETDTFLVYDTLIAKIPGDGTLTGNYGIYTYASSSLTDASSSLDSSSYTNLTPGTPTRTSHTSTLTNATTNFIPSLINL